MSLGLGGALLGRFESVQDSLVCHGPRVGEEPENRLLLCFGEAIEH